MTIQTASINSPYGKIELKGSAELGLKSLKIFVLEKEQNETVPEALVQAVQELKEYFEGKRKYFTIKLDWSESSDFFKKVWAELLQIPYGQTTSYINLAKKINNEKAVRAVGMANAKNPIPIIVPCHRVIGKNGALTGFFYGLEMKKQLLQFENPNAFGIQKDLKLE